MWIVLLVILLGSNSELLLHSIKTFSSHVVFMPSKDIQELPLIIKMDSRATEPRQTVFKSPFILYPLNHKMHLYLSRGGNKHELRYLYDPLVTQDHDELLPGESVHGRPDDHPLVPRPEPGQGAQRQERVHPARHLLQDWGVLHR